VKKPDRLYGDMTIETSKTLFKEYNSAGKGPVYMDMNGISQEDLAYMVHWLQNEGNGAILNNLAEEGVDLARAAIEFQSFELGAGGGVGTNHRGETTVEGLYAAGDEVWGTISHAAVFGWSAGENAARHARKAAESSMTDGSPTIEAEKAFVEEVRNRKDGPCWQEALSALQQIMIDYCGHTRSESLLSAGLDVIKRLKNKARSSLCAGNAHELMHCLEVLNLIDAGELVMEGAYDRCETRGLHVRSDYPLTNPLLTDKYHVVRRAEDGPSFGWA
jgi:succinate dehydrogenase/fumarate reductase flavoprotein subunit